MSNSINKWITYDEEAGEFEAHSSYEDAHAWAKKKLREWVVDEGAPDSYIYIAKIVEEMTATVNDITYNVEIVD